MTSINKHTLIRTLQKRAVGSPWAGMGGHRTKSWRWRASCPKAQQHSL